MNNAFSGLNTEKMEDSRDSLGGFGPRESDAYDATIKAAYSTKSANGALGLGLVLAIDGRDYTETLWVTNRQGQPYYTRDDKKIPLPGYTTADEICTLVTGKGLSEQSQEEKVIKLYDFQARSEVPTKVQMLTDLLGGKIRVGLLKTVEDKNTKNDDGSYSPSGETREQNSINKVFHGESRLTVNEIKASKEAPEFHDAWVQKNKGAVVNNSKAKGEGKSGSPAAAAKASAGSAKPLFDN